MLDGYKKRSLPWQPSCEDLLVKRPMSVKTIDSTGQGHCRRIEVSLFIDLLSYCLFHFCFSFYNQFLQCVSCCLLACVFDWCSFFRITDKLLPFDLLSILILDKLCMNLLCLYRYIL